MPNKRVHNQPVQNSRNWCQWVSAKPSFCVGSSLYPSFKPTSPLQYNYSSDIPLDFLRQTVYDFLFSGEASTVLSVMADQPIFRITGFATFNYHTPLHEVLNHLLTYKKTKKGHLFRRSKKGPTLIFCAIGLISSSLYFSK